MARLTRNTMVSYGYVYKVVYPSGKFYIGSDVGSTAELNQVSYLGSSFNREKMLLDNIRLMEAHQKLTITKEFLYAARDCTCGEIWDKERECIRLAFKESPGDCYNLK